MSIRANEADWIAERDLLLERVGELEDLLRKIRQWDALNPPIQGPYGDATWFVAEIDRVLAVS